MAGERKGIANEAIVKLALDNLVRRRKLIGKVMWNEKPDGMTIEPDFTIGPDRNSPTHIFLVSNINSAKNSDMKFWRNIGELAEAKVRLRTVPRVYSIVFDTVIKPDLKVLQASAFDGQLLVGETTYGRELQSWVAKHAMSLPKDRDKKVEAIVALSKDPSLLPLLANVERDIAALFVSSRVELDRLWEMDRRRKVNVAPAARETFLRRGSSKLLLLDRIDMVDSSGYFDKSAPKRTVDSLVSMGLATPTIRGPRITDKEMLWAMNNFSSDVLTRLHAARSIERLSELIEGLQNCVGVRDQLNFLSSNWQKVISAKGLFQLLSECHSDPHALCPAAVCRGSRQVWLFHLIIEWIKLSTGTRTGYGLAALVDDLDRISLNKVHRKSVREMVGRDVIWAGKHTVLRRLSDWYSVASKTNFVLTVDDLARIADVLAERLRNSPRPVAGDDAVRIQQAIVQNLLEAKLLTYRGFTPLLNLLDYELKKHGIDGKLERAVRSCFAEAASDSGQSINRWASGTTVMRVKNTLINWQSASDAGRDHKKKELCGRAVALRYQWDPGAKAFVKRSCVDKLILILDGTWRQEDLNALVAAGWDEIFYPDEMERLTEALI